MNLLWILSGGLLACVLFRILAALCRVPDQRRIAALQAALGAADPQESALERSIGELSDAISRKMKMEGSKRELWVKKLHAAGIGLSPEQYLSKALVKGLLIAVWAIPFLFFMPGMAFLPLAGGILCGWQAYGEADRRTRSRIEEIEEELPRLVDTIEKNLSHTRDIVGILENYRPVAGPVMAEELGITLADLRSGHAETALMRLELRVGSSLLGELCRGIISVLQGDDTAFYWAQLSMKLKENRRQMLRRKAMQLPRKISRLSMVVMFCFLLLYLVVIFYETVQSLSLLFG